MPEKTIFVYRMEQPAMEPDRVTGDGLQFRTWRPGIASFIPPNSPVSYLYLWMMHVLKIFKNRDYSAYSIIDNGRNVCSLVCVPALYKWPFMSRVDLQIKNVFTHEEYRGKGYASRLIQYTLGETLNVNRVYWYMTDEGNIPSQKLCIKIGFKYVGKYRRKRNRYLLYEGEIVQDK
jgi:GNAT superfamily N-acetyltransferase